MFRLDFATHTPVFYDAPAREVSRILKVIADQILVGDSGPVRDVDGRLIGAFCFNRSEDVAPRGPACPDVPILSEDAGGVDDSSENLGLVIFEPDSIVVVVEGGCVVDVRRIGLNNETSVYVVDYDTEGSSPNECHVDHKGRLCVVDHQTVLPGA